MFIMNLFTVTFQPLKVFCGHFQSTLTNEIACKQNPYFEQLQKIEKHIYFPILPDFLFFISTCARGHLSGNLANQTTEHWAERVEKFELFFCLLNVQKSEVIQSKLMISLYFVSLQTPTQTVKWKQGFVDEIINLIVAKFLILVSF